mmetsp:Transcript_9444/g.19914  ORF Transcript_9444/g.19914 Transcript_9444/m.19914 type:complete len:544 (+) Transcript_9444:92-1723(+)
MKQDSSVVLLGAAFVVALLCAQYVYALEGNTRRVSSVGPSSINFSGLDTNERFGKILSARPDFDVLRADSETRINASARQFPKTPLTTTGATEVNGTTISAEELEAARVAHQRRLARIRLQNAEHLIESIESNTDSLPAWLLKYARWHTNQFAALQESILANETNPRKVKYLMYHCSHDCGGLGDRLRGIVSVLYLAIATDRVFLIHTPQPPLRISFASAYLQWDPMMWGIYPRALNVRQQTTVNGAQTKLIQSHSDSSNSEQWLQLFKTNSGDPVLINMLASVPQSEPHVMIKTNLFLWSRVLPDPRFSAAFRRWRAPKVGAPLTIFEGQQLFTHAFRLLFKISHSLEISLKELETALELGNRFDNAFVAVHWRFGSARLGDYTRHGLTHASKYAVCAKRMMERIAKEQSIKTGACSVPVFLATDEEIARIAFLNELNASCQAQGGVKTVAVSPYAAVHVDRAQGSFRNYLHTIAEFALLMRAPCTVSSRSGFSEMAVLGSMDATTGSRCWARFDFCSEHEIDVSVHDPQKAQIFPPITGEL